MKILITGSAGFIGFHVVKALLARGCNVVGIDNLNEYYDVRLKYERLSVIDEYVEKQGLSGNYLFYKLDLVERSEIAKVFSAHRFDVVVNLAAQAGVRYSIENPYAYVDSNLVGFVNVLEESARNKVGHLVYASSSSVYGVNIKQPFSTLDCVDYPISLYAATKKSNELMAHAYSHLYDMPCTGLRFFTVYGPYGRPDMAYYKFTKSILDGAPIDVYNGGEMRRDFTYIDDIVDGILRVIDNTPSPMSRSDVASNAPYKIYNIGNNNPVSLRDFISAIEKACGKKALENLLPMQPGDVPSTYADIDDLVSDTGFSPVTSIDLGIKNFVEWYKTYYD